MNIRVGNATIHFHRTVRVKEEGISALPPSLGLCEIYKVSDYATACPKNWDERAYFIALHDIEALWLAFTSTEPTALIIGAGGINALTGEKLIAQLEEENYLVVPTQPWLDGWKDKTGCVYQFVTTEFQKGEGCTIGEQILGGECVTGGIGIAAFEGKDTEELIPPPPVYSNSGYGVCSLTSLTTCDFESKEMGIGKGGKIDQKIYADPYGIKVWKEKPVELATIYLINAAQFSKITGQPMPPLPASFDEYKGNWFTVDDKKYPDINGTDKFDKLKKVKK